MPFDKIKYQHLLPSVLKPTRYINQELNSFRKIPSKNTINFCLAFPDVYEVGFSHLGLKILYSILNNEKDAVADRVYAPWPDFAEKLKENKIPLFGLESKVAVKDFDVLGFTLQSELTFTNILYTLDLAQIPLFSKDRNEEHPLILGGGPCSTNPEPLTDFFDAFLIGDAEEAIIEIKNCLKKNRSKSHEEKLQKLAEIEGIYVPALFNKNSNRKIRIRKFLDFNNPTRSHQNQLIPWLEPTHFRYVAEIMRGCTRGCRFCHAGMFYRPVREKDSNIIFEELIREIKQFGWDEAAITSLSTSDYSCIKSLLFELYEHLNKQNVSLSLPSLRVDTIDDELTKLLNAMKQTGLTIAPEAGTQGLRNIINKNITEDDILQSIEIALKNGWKLIKLYFMIGLPFEEEKDIDGIIRLIEKIVRNSQKKLRINITISPFVPKVFTPFQWSKMDSRESLQRKADKIKYSLNRYKFIKIKYHEIKSSILECILGRGSRKTGKLLHSAYQNGAKFDGWNEYFDFGIWEKAAAESDINFEKFLSEIPLDSCLDWEHIDIGIDKNFLLKEWENAKNEITLEDCKTGKCSACGICNSEISNIYAEKKKTKRINTHLEKQLLQQNYFHYRVFFEKKGIMQFVAHLDLVRMLQRIVRVSRLPIVFTQGFNVHPRISPGPPLPVGVQGENEYCDFVLKREIDLNEIETKLKLTFPDTLKVKKIEFLQNKKQRAMEFFKYEEIEIEIPKQFSEHFEKRTNNFLDSEEWFFTRIRKGKEQTSNLKQLIKEIYLKNNVLNITKSIIGASIFDVLRKIYEVEREKTGDFVIIRKRLLPEG